MRKKNTGITLIALVITIIVMLILAGVALSMIGGDEGILTKAESAVNATKTSGAQEQVDLLLAGFSTKYYQEKYIDENPTVKNQEVKDYVIDQIGDGMSTSDGAYFVTTENGEINVYEGEDATEENLIASGTLENGIKVNWQQSTVGGSGETPEPVVIPEGFEVGDTVTYSPSGTYKWQAEYASSDLADNGTADITLATGTQVATGTQDMSLTSWKVLSIDEATGNVELVSSNPTTKDVRLHGAQGYNNGVKMLNDAFNRLYGNGSTITARSINIDDIEDRMTETALAEAHSYVNSMNMQYGTKVATPHTERRAYPVIYAKENKSVIDGIEKTTGLKRSEPNTELIGRTDSGATLGYLNATTSIQPYQTYYLKDNTFMQTAFSGNGTGTSNMNYNLLLPQNTKTYYWLATRCVENSQGVCDFKMPCVGAGQMHEAHMYYSYIEAPNDAQARPLFPIVSLSINLVKGNDTEGWNIQ